MRAPVFHHARHDHARCVSHALAEARQVCAERAVRFTPLRERVLEIVWRSHRPLGAYDILHTLTGEGRSAAPPTVYRALEFLRAQGLVHRIASLNAFVGCARPGHRQPGQFLICRACGCAAELTETGVDDAIVASAAALGFEVEHRSVEVTGICPHCERGAP